MNRALMSAKRLRRATRTFAVLAMLVALVLAVSVHAAGEPGANGESDKTDAPWKVIKVKAESGGEISNRGLMLFTTDESQPGAAFRCQNGELFTYLSTRPLNFRAQLDHPFANSRNREVSYRIDGVGEGTGIWVQMYRGRVYLVTEGPTSVGVFETAVRGGEVSFTRKHQEPLSIELPGIGEDTLGDFLAGCDLESRYRPANT